MSLKLTVMLSGRVVDRWEFEPSIQSVVIGRHEDCDIRLDHRTVSRHHCEILGDGELYVVRDKHSNNGTLVNGERIETCNLNEGDTITVGEFSIRYSLDRPEGGPTFVPRASGMDIRTLQVDPTRLGELQRARSSKVRGHLLAPGAGGRPRTILLQKAIFVIGKESDADYQLGGGRFAARVSALILRDELGFWVLDVSPKGTSVRVNGEPTRRLRLKDADEVSIQDAHVRFMRGMPGRRG